MVAFGLASIMLCVGLILRAKIKVLRDMLVPTSVIAGVLGCLFMNLCEVGSVSVGTNAGMFSTIVDNLFTVSFISISLTSAPKKDNGAKNILKGAVGMGLVWCLLYALTPLIGGLIVLGLGSFVGMNEMYGTLIPFAFTQGPGQAAAFGSIYESNGWENAMMVAVTFAAVGFLAAFLVGIPAARIGIKRGIAKNCNRIEDKILRGYLKKDEQDEYMVKDTTCSSNIETLTFHFALIGLCYVLAIGISKVLGYLPGFLGNSMSGLMFMNGMYAAYIVKFLLKVLKLDFLQENTLQSKITGWTADYLVVCAFMAVSVNVIGKWMPVIAVECIVITIVTAAVCFYFGRRFGGENDFERTLGLYGTCTGTVPSGIALVRIVDSQFKTATAVELGMMNLVMLACTPVYIILLALAAGSIGFNLSMILLGVCSLVYIVALKLTRTWGKSTYSWKEDKKNA